MRLETLILEDGREIVIVHFLVQVKHQRDRIACMPHLESFSAGKYRESPMQRTNDVRSVSCPMCKSSTDYKKASAELRGAIGEFKMK